MSTRRCSAATWALCLVPPKIVGDGQAHGPGQRQDHRVDLAGQLPGGHKDQAARGRRWYGPLASRAASGIANASVLPEPVRPRPRTSIPARASGSAAAWIGNGTVMPASASTASSGSGDAQLSECHVQRGHAGHTVGGGGRGYAACCVGRDGAMADKRGTRVSPGARRRWRACEFSMGRAVIKHRFRIQVAASSWAATSHPWKTSSLTDDVRRRAARWRRLHNVPCVTSLSHARRGGMRDGPSAAQHPRADTGNKFLEALVDPGYGQLGIRLCVAAAAAT